MPKIFSRLPAILLGGLLVATLAACAKPPDKAAFVEQVAAEARKSLPGSTVTLTPAKTVQVRYADGTIVASNLDDLWRQCTNDPKICEAARAKAVKNFLQAASRPAVRRDQVLAMIKTRAWIDNARKDGGSPIVRPFIGDLWKVYILDFPDGMRVLDPSDLKTLKLTEDELDVLAISNLDRQLTAFPHMPVEEGSPVRVLRVGDSYESARLLLHYRWRGLAGEVKGDLLASAPNRDAVYFVGSGESPETLLTFRLRMKELSRTEAYPLSPQILRWTAGRWVVQSE